MRWAVLALHAGIIGTLVVQIAYIAWVFVFVLSADVGFPLAGNALAVDHELMVTRRLYAIEGWGSFGLLAIYLAITEVVPRRRRR